MLILLISKENINFVLKLKKMLATILNFAHN